MSLDNFLIENQLCDVEGVKVKLNPDYADNDPDEIFTIQYDWDERKCWISDNSGRGWFVHYGGLIFVSEGD